MLCFGRHYHQECYQLKPTFDGKTNKLKFESFKKVTDSLYTHGHGTKIASIQGYLIVKSLNREWTGKIYPGSCINLRSFGFLKV